MNNINNIKLVWEPKDVRTVLKPSCDILIDGQSLSEQVNEIYHIDKYGPIECPDYPERYFYGYNDKYDEVRGKKAIIECKCGYGCGNVVACKITQEDERIIWSDFVTVRGKKLPELGRFVFDEPNYFNEVMTLLHYT